MSQVTRRGGNGDKRVHLQPGQRKPRREQRGAKLILISQWALLSYMQDTNRKKETSSFCQAGLHNSAQLQGCLFDLIWPWSSKQRYSFLTEAQRSHCKVISLFFSYYLGKVLVVYWPLTAGIQTLFYFFAAASVSAKTEQKLCLSALYEDKHLW